MGIPHPQTLELVVDADDVTQSDVGATYHGDLLFFFCAFRTNFGPRFVWWLNGAPSPALRWRRWIPHGSSNINVLTVAFCERSSVSDSNARGDVSNTSD
jgi:hypothetical protein